MAIYEIELRAARRLYPLLLWPWVLTTVLWGVVILRNAVAGSDISWLWQYGAALAFCVAVGGLFWFWLRAFRIVATPTAVTYGTLLGGSRRAPMSDVLCIQWERGYARPLDALKPPRRLVLVLADRRIEINASVFKEDEMAALVEYLNDRLRTAKTDIDRHS